MNITFGILHHFLAKNYSVQTNITPDTDSVIRKFRIWNGETPEKEVLYLSSSLPGNQKAWQDCCCLFLDGTKNPVGWRGRYIHLILGETEPAGLLAAVNILNEIMEGFNEWLLCRPEEFGDLAGLLTSFEKMTGWPVSLVDRHLHFSAVSENYYNVAGWIPDRNLSYMPIEFVNELMLDDNFRNAITHREPFFYTGSDSTVPAPEFISCFNIYRNEKYKARLLVQPPDDKKHIGQKALTQALGEKVTELLEATGQMDSSAEVYEFYRMMERLLAGQAVPEAELEKRLKTRGWKMDHSYEVIVFSFMEEGNGTITSQYYGKNIERMEGDSAALPMEEGICCIRNRSLTAVPEQEIRQKHALFLRENLCKSGTSQVFCDLQQLSSYYQEAKIALEFGNLSGRTEWNYHFEQYQLEYLLKEASGSLSPEQLLHPAYRILENYDREKHASLLETALVYMKAHYNVTSAAEELHIHRTSLLFRLERIEKLTGFDWNNWKELLHLSLSFALMERK